LATIRKNRADDAKARQKENDKQKQMTQKERLIPDRNLKCLKVADVDSKKNVGDTRSRAMKRRKYRPNESLWDNIRKRRAAGKRKLRPGDKNYPKTLNIDELTGVGSIPNPAQTAMGPTGKGMVSYVHDRRKRKKDHYALVKRFKDYLVQNGVI